MSSSGEPEILFVEDNPFDVELTLRALKGCGFSDRVKVARDGKEALDYLFGEGPYKGRRIEEGPRLVLLDLKLPKVTGLQVLQWVRADPRTKELPVIILTSFEDDREVVEIFRLGVTGYLVKPLNKDEFCTLARKSGLEVAAPDAVAPPTEHPTSP
ncbi:MAG TPA: response regulator [Planctomycetota bacterium]|nr:response regulator [Planctomycetota bacterium]